MLCGLLWEERRSVRRIEVEFPSAPATVPSVQQLRFFGPVAYEIVSDVDHGKINARVEMPARHPPEGVVLRFRHPWGLPIQSVSVNGQEWKRFSKEQETIELKGLAGTVAVTASY
jgi:hypothetical protein